MSRLLLLGDSIIDNGKYVNLGEPDVSEQLQALKPSIKVVRRAIDGAITQEVLDVQTSNIDETDAIVVSSGGNDALSNVEILDSVFDTKSRDVLVKLWNIRKEFQLCHENLLKKLIKYSPRVLVCTIYDPAFFSTGMDIEDQYAGEASLSTFNDVIQMNARKFSCDILELREIFTQDDDFANPIEPSAKGGSKLAAAISNWYTEC